MNSSISLRPYQEEALRIVEERYDAGVHRQALQLPTGAGKTICFAELINRRGGRALIIAHREELLDQAQKKLAMVAPHLSSGIVKAARNEVCNDVLIASIQSLGRDKRLEKFNHTFDTVIVDEMHHSAAAGYRKVLEHCVGPDSLLLGVSATIERADRLRMDDLYDEVVYEVSMLDLIERGYLSDIRAVQVMVDVSLGQLHKRGGDYVDSELATALREANAPDKAVAAYEAHAAGRKALLFAPTVDLAVEFAAAFEEAGYRTGTVWGDQDIEKRHATLEAFSKGEIRILTNCMVLTEGYDEPSVECVIVARPTCSTPLYTQMVGRGTRTFPGKENLLLLDLVGATTKHDLMTAATLFGVNPKALEEKDLTEVVEDDRAELEIEQGKQAVMGEIVAREVDLFARHKLHWTMGDGLYSLSAGDGGLVVVKQVPDLLPDMPAFTYTVELVGRRQQGSFLPNVSVLGEHLDLGYAQGIAEQYVRDQGATRLNDPKARWRGNPPTEKQMETLVKMRVKTVPTTASEASDLISQAIAKFSGVKK